VLFRKINTDRGRLDDVRRLKVLFSRSPNSCGTRDIFNEWAKEEYQNKEGLEWIAIDGKGLRSTVIDYDKATQNFVIFASFFSQETGIVLHLERWENKESSEVHQVQDMLRDTELTGRIFTLDALHSNQVTPQEIIDSNNDYLIC
jgi:hypothetical protein